MLPKIKKSAKNKTAQEYEQMGRQLEALYDSTNPRRGALYRTALIKGMITGAGGVIGATVLIALLAWILSFFDSVPLVGGLVDVFRHTITNQ